MAKLAGQPRIWFPLALLLLAAVGALLLAQPTMTRPEARGRESYWAYHDWRCVFDSLSAACGSGLLLYKFDEEYTPAGRWVLTALGVGGAVLYLAAIGQALCGAAVLGGAQVHETRCGGRRLVVGFLCATALAAGATWLTARALTFNEGIGDAAWRATAAFASLGWSPGVAAGELGCVSAVLALCGAMCGLVLARGLLDIRPRQALRAAVCFLAIAAFGAALLFVFEAPRGEAELRKEGGVRGGPSASAAAEERSGRMTWSTGQAGAAVGAGMPLDPERVRTAREGAKIALAGLELLGGLPGSAGGGVGGLFLLTLFVRGAARRTPPIPAAAGLLLLVVSCTAIVALGLLLIENTAASRFAVPPTFADAFLDAASAFAGGGLSSGLTATVTARSLSSGMGQPADQYQYGMVWLMLAMLVGRVLPVLVFARLAPRR